VTRFSANLGFLWKELPLPDAIRAAKAAGFDAVECHFPYAVPPGEVIAALKETSLVMLGLNTIRGDAARGDNGLAALPGRQKEARAAIDQAIDYAATIGACNVHVMAGIAEGDTARQVFCANLRYACDAAEPKGLTILIEALNPADAPGYFLGTTRLAEDILNEVGAPNLKLMFDCYHVGRTEGDVIGRLRDLLPHVGHIQFASVPGRGRPDEGDLDYREVFQEIARLGWSSPLGAEYRPAGPTEASLGWMSGEFRHFTPKPKQL
jgi:hydroxypyruvate isomerase